MNIEEQRNTFETECKLLKYSGDMTRHHIGNFYIDQTTNWMYQMWLSSKNRQGYKLVPVQPSNDTIVAIERKVEEQLEASAIDADPFRLDGENIYKAMVGACDD